MSKYRQIDVVQPSSSSSSSSLWIWSTDGMFSCIEFSFVSLCRAQCTMWHTRHIFIFYPINYINLFISNINHSFIIHWTLHLCTYIILLHHYHHLLSLKLQFDFIIFFYLWQTPKLHQMLIILQKNIFLSII